MLNSQLMLNLNRNMQNMQNLSTQNQTGRKINKPSDDPVGITYSLRYRSELAANEQYQKNIDSSLSWLTYTDDMLGQAGEVMQRIRELAVKGATGTNSDESLKSIAKEIGELRNQVAEVGNSTLNGKYIFNGEQYDIKPYDEEALLASGKTLQDVVTDNEYVQFEIGKDLVTNISISGNEVFGNPGEDDQIFKVIDRITTALSTGKMDDVNKELDSIDSRMEKMLSARAEIGARTNRVELMEGRMKDLGINLTDLKSKVEDADLAEVVMNMKIAENIYQASLSAGSKIIQPSLADFIR